MARILVIEDEVNIRETLVDILEGHNYEVIEAASGMAGLIKTVKEKPDLIISDVNMPELNGFEMLEGLKECLDEKLIPPFIFLSAKVERSSIRKGMNLGADDYIAKPFQNKDVLDAIKTKLEKRTEEKEKILTIEREKISRYLHDSVQNLLLGSFLGFRSLRDKISSLDTESQTTFESSFEMLNQALIDLRDYSHNVGKHELVDDIESKIQFLINSTKEISKLEISSNCSITTKPSPKIQTYLYYIIQEVLNNILKHAEANKANINFQCNEKGVTLEISDNGKGYDTAQLSDGIGIQGLTKKAEAIGADIEIKSKVGQGSQVLLELTY